MFDTLVRKLKGIGQCSTPGQLVNGNKQAPNCLYFKDGHPGCAIGCQPGFLQFKELLRGLSEPIEFLMNDHPDIHDFFDGCEEDFLKEIQALHDDPKNWRSDNSLTLTARKAFVEAWGLKLR